ncbi:MAG: uronate isomerase [Cyclobacteriaceae bacterium]|nr:MAG: uronate isomerase [Cyclobacteriaceae bacterium]
MPNFIYEDFLLSNEFSRRLYHDHAVDMPIIDYHNHLIPEHLANNHQFKDLTEAWLAGDHYKWRAMRANGIDEKYITGSSSSSREKFIKWAETVPYTLGNPLFHWTHLELGRYFEIYELLNPTSAPGILNQANEMLQQEEFRARNLVVNKNVEVVCTTDDPSDPLIFHEQLREGQHGLKVFPTFRPDKMCTVKSLDYPVYIRKLGELCDQEINTFQDLLDVACQRIEDFNAIGCRLSDHGLTHLPDVNHNDEESARTFDKVMSGSSVSLQDAEVFMITVLHHLCQWYADKGWTQQFHLGAIRNNNSRLLNTQGTDVGADSMGDFQQIQGLSRFLDGLDAKEKLARTIIYNNNPVNNASFATMVANFNEHPTPGKMQFGASWWFLDQYHGIIAQLQDLSNYGLLSRFVGMLTDSRSFLSFPRHEYFRRVLCNELGKEMEAGRLPEDIKMIGSMVEDICYNNAKNYFNFE